MRTAYMYLPKKLDNFPPNRLNRFPPRRIICPPKRIICPTVIIFCSPLYRLTDGFRKLKHVLAELDTSTNENVCQTSNNFVQPMKTVVDHTCKLSAIHIENMESGIHDILKTFSSNVLLRVASKY